MLKYINCLKKSFLDHYVNEIINNECIQELMKNKYGSFILSKLFSLVEPNIHIILRESIKKNINNIHATNFKNKWQSFIDKSNENFCFSPLTPLSGMIKNVHYQKN